jgi:hypothetical protein
MGVTECSVVGRRRPFILATHRALIYAPLGGRRARRPLRNPSAARSVLVVASEEKLDESRKSVPGRGLPPAEAGRVRDALRALRAGYPSGATLARALGVDAGTVSRTLAPERPSAPSAVLAAKVARLVEVRRRPPRGHYRVWSRATGWWPCEVVDSSGASVVYVGPAGRGVLTFEDWAALTVVPVEEEA